ncbi:cytosolic sulfotransferase 5-like [Spinacia oleracea]|uniref:Sulfotransferase n=1 Tax=Spinacia oleracea TaxID=3562 RepID=A0A9R0ITQ6_SPIOL|nr:cytosolic sulfotransferase 5-like [Spinacia oleracea]
MMNQNDNQTKETKLLQEEEVEQLKQCLPKTNFLGSKLELVNYQGFWCQSNAFKQIFHYQTHFQARNSDIFLASLPKTVTTWLKSLLFCIVNRPNNVDNHHHQQPLIKFSPLLNHNPHELVYHLDLGVYGDNPILPRPNQLNDLPSPRLLHTHFPYQSLPESIKDSSCKILYIARNPLDTCVSQWFWHTTLIKKRTKDEDFQPPTIEEFFEEFCLGKFPYGPYFEHVIEFWKQSLEQPNKVLFLKYEDLKGDNAMLHLKKLAEFLGLPFSFEEESNGVINEIMEFCSIDNLKELEVNKIGFMNKFVEKKNFFRKGEVGDWTNYFTPPMIDKINTLMEQKLGGSGLSFQQLPQS